MEANFPKNVIDFLQKKYIGVVEVADYESDIKFSKNKMAVLKWRITFQFQKLNHERKKFRNQI